MRKRLLRPVARFAIASLFAILPAGCRDGEATATGAANPVSQADAPRFTGGEVLSNPAAAIAFRPLPSETPVVGDLSLMSFNIRYANPNDGANIWANRKAQLFALVRAKDPDIIGFQEVLIAQHEEMKTNLTAYATVGVGRDDGKTRGEMSPVYFRAARFRADTSGTFWFSDTPEIPGSKSWGNSITRICTWARLVDKVTGRGWYFFNVHLDHESQPSREKSVLLLLERIGAVRNPSEPVFVAGDFNVGENDPVIRFIKGRQSLGGKTNPMPMVDSFRSIDSTSTAVATWHDFTGDAAGDKIDFVFLQPRIRTVAAAIVRDNLAGKYPSDHFPVTASVIVPDWAFTSLRRP